MRSHLEFRGTWLTIFGNILLIGILTTITLGIYAPWGYVRWKRMVLSDTYFRDRPLQFDGSGGSAFIEFLIVGALTIVTLGLYAVLGFASARILRWEKSHTVLPSGRRLEYRGAALDLFIEYLLLAIFTPLTLGLYYFWGYARLRRHIVTNTFVDGLPLEYTGSGGQYFVVGILNILLTVLTLSLYLVLGFATLRVLRWDAENTLVPVPVEGSTTAMPMGAPVNVSVNVGGQPA